MHYIVWAQWQMIVFEHNQHQVDACRALAKKYKFKKFYTRSENRFPKDSNSQTVYWKGQASHVIKPPTIAVEADVDNTWSTAFTTKSTGVDCLSQKTGWLSFYADGTVWPCCFLMGWHLSPHQSAFPVINYHFKKVLGLDFDQISLYTNKLQDIVASDLWQNRYPQSFAKAPNPVCTQQCSK